MGLAVLTMTTQERAVSAGGPGAPAEAETMTWLTAEDLAAQLHCSERQIHQLKADGLFKPGEHYYAIGGGSRGRHVYALELCRQALLDQTKKQKVLARSKKRATYDKDHLDQLIKGGSDAPI